MHTCHLWDSHVFTLFVCEMQRIHKHKKVGCALTESVVVCSMVGIACFLRLGFVRIPIHAWSTYHYEGNLAMEEYSG